MPLISFGVCLSINYGYFSTFDPIILSYMNIGDHLSFLLQRHSLVLLGMGALFSIFLTFFQTLSDLRNKNKLMIAKILAVTVTGANLIFFLYAFRSYGLTWTILGIFLCLTLTGLYLSRRAWTISDEYKKDKYIDNMSTLILLTAIVLVSFVRVGSQAAKLDFSSKSQHSIYFHNKKIQVIIIAKLNGGLLCLVKNKWILFGSDKVIASGKIRAL
jgi:hypothetical protein